MLILFGFAGLRVSPKAPTEVWARNLSNGDVAVALLNKGDGSPAHGVDNCEWAIYVGGYNESTGGSAGNDGCSHGKLTLEEARDEPNPLYDPVVLSLD